MKPVEMSLFSVFATFPLVFRIGIVEMRIEIGNFYLLPKNRLRTKKIEN